MFSTLVEYYSIMGEFIITIFNFFKSELFILLMMMTIYRCENEGGDCGGDGPSFKGVFARNLGELDRILEGRPYRPWLIAQTDANYQRNRNSLDQYGVHWAGPFDKADAARQHSTLEVFTAAHATNRAKSEKSHILNILKSFTFIITILYTKIWQCV